MNSIAATPSLGTLNWLPAATHPELLAPAVVNAIGELPAFVAPIDPDLADTAAFCAEYEVGLDVSANCVIVEGRRGENSTLAAVLVLATDRADVNKTIRTHLGARKTSFAAMDTATTLTGMEYGGITPVGLPADWPILIDEAVVGADWLIIGSGIRGSKIAIQGQTLASLPGAETLSLAV